MTHCGGGKSGSPTQRDVTTSPSASICFTREKTSTVLEGLIWDRSGLRDGCDDDDDDDDGDDDDGNDGDASLYSSKENRHRPRKIDVRDDGKEVVVALRDKQRDGERAALVGSVIAAVIASSGRENLHMMMMIL
jgi:hypothetical protein